VNTEYVSELEGAGSETELRIGVPAGPSAGLRVPVARERARRVRRRCSAIRSASARV